MNKISPYLLSGWSVVWLLIGFSVWPLMVSAVNVYNVLTSIWGFLEIGNTKTTNGLSIKMTDMGYRMIFGVIFRGHHLHKYRAQYANI